MLSRRYICGQRRHGLEGEVECARLLYLFYPRFPLQTLDAKKEWNVHFEAYIRGLDKKKPVIWTGDLNVAPTEMGMPLRSKSIA